MLRKISAILLTGMLTLALALPQAGAEEEKRKYTQYAKNGQPIGWTDGYDMGDKWFGEDFAYDITDTAACWELLQKPITVLDVGEKESVYPLDAPNGKKVLSEWQGGFINGASAAVHVLGENEDGWTLIEGLDYYNRIIRGYVRTKLLKTVTPNSKYGLIIDKLYQRLYVFIDGELWSSCAVSTGLVNDGQPYNETAAGEYLLVSWVGGFGDDTGMYCEMGMRFNGGDLFHLVPYETLRDGTKRFDKFESQLGQKASHGCIRVPRVASEEGLNISWMWNNLKKGTKVIIWDDAGRLLPYPEDSLNLYYNPDGGQNYHALERCGRVKDKFLPLTGFTYSQLDTAPYSSLTPCNGCAPAKRKAEIDQMNRDRGLDIPQAAQPTVDIATDEGNGGDEPAESPSTGSVADSSLSTLGEDEIDENGGATHHPVVITITSPED